MLQAGLAGRGLVRACAAAWIRGGVVWAGTGSYDWHHRDLRLDQDHLGRSSDHQLRLLERGNHHLSLHQIRLHLHLPHLPHDLASLALHWLLLDGHYLINRLALLLHGVLLIRLDLLL